MKKNIKNIIFIILIIICIGVIIYFIKKNEKYSPIKNTFDKKLSKKEQKIQKVLENMGPEEKKKLFIDIQFIVDQNNYYSKKNILNGKFVRNYLNLKGGYKCKECKDVLIEYNIKNKNELNKWINNNSGSVDDNIFKKVEECGILFFSDIYKCNPKSLIEESEWEKIIESKFSDGSMVRALTGVFDERMIKIFKDEGYFKLKEIIGDLASELFSALYKGFFDKSGLDNADLYNILVSVGVAGLDVGLSMVGLGYFSGFLKDLFKPIKNEIPTFNPAEADKKLVAAGYTMENLQQVLIELKQIIVSMPDNLYGYQEYKYERTRTLCPDPSGCQKLKSSSDQCDYEKTLLQTEECITKNEYDMGDYDPSIEKQSVTLNKSRRQELEDYINSPDFPLRILVTKDYLTNLYQMSAYNITISNMMYSSYISVFSYYLTYFQELAIIDTKYVNPYISSWTGNREKAGSEQKGRSILGVLQTRCKEFYNYIVRMFNQYFENLNIQFGEITNFPGRDPTRGKSVIIDSNGIMDYEWYMAMSNNYELTSIDGFEATGLYAQEAEIRNFVKKIIYDNGYEKVDKYVVTDEYDELCKEYNITRYMVFFNEKLNFPLQNLMVLRKQAGFDDDFTSDDLFSGILYDIYNENNSKFIPQSDYEIKNNVNLLYNGGFKPPVYFDKTRMNNYDDKNGGYPFGFTNPSYKEGIKMCKDYEQNKELNIQNTKNCDLYSAPYFNVTPGDSIDPTIYNKIVGSIPINNKNMYCADPNANFIKNSLIAGANPIKDNKITYNRVTYCYNSNTGFASNLIEKPPTNYKIPTPPSDFKYKIWKLENEKIKSVLVLDSLGEYTYNNKEIFAINWSQTTLTFNLPDNLDEILLVFGPDEVIIGGKLGNFGLFNVPVNYTKQNNLPNIPNEKLIKRNPQIKINNKSFTCAFEYKLYINNELLLQGTNYNGHENTDWIYVDGDSDLRFEAKNIYKGIGRDTNWITLTKELKRGKQYEIYQDCACDLIDSDPCININESNQVYEPINKITGNPYFKFVNESILCPIRYQIYNGDRLILDLDYGKGISMPGESQNYYVFAGSNITIKYKNRHADDSHWQTHYFNNIQKYKWYKVYNYNWCSSPWREYDPSVTFEEYSYAGYIKFVNDSNLCPINYEVYNGNKMILDLKYGKGITSPGESQYQLDFEPGSNILIKYKNRNLDIWSTYSFNNFQNNKWYKVYNYQYCSTPMGESNPYLKFEENTV